MTAMGNACGVEKLDTGSGDDTNEPDPDPDPDPDLDAEDGDECGECGDTVDASDDEVDQLACMLAGVAMIRGGCCMVAAATTASSCLRRAALSSISWASARRSCLASAFLRLSLALVVRSLARSFSFSSRARRSSSDTMSSALENRAEFEECAAVECEVVGFGGGDGLGAMACTANAEATAGGGDGRTATTAGGVRGEMV
jgi:hypothetical protein